MGYKIPEHYNPGYGYRFLGMDEVVQAGDQFSANGNFVLKNGNPDCWDDAFPFLGQLHSVVAGNGHEYDALIRRRIEPTEPVEASPEQFPETSEAKIESKLPVVPDGWRLLRDDETIERGDMFCLDVFRSDWSHCGSSIGSTPATFDYGQDSATRVIRKIETPQPVSSIPETAEPEVTLTPWQQAENVIDKHVTGEHVAGKCWGVDCQPPKHKEGVWLVIRSDADGSTQYIEFGKALGVWPIA